jgi:hypothetical protein
VTHDDQTRSGDRPREDRAAEARVLRVLEDFRGRIPPLGSADQAAGTGLRSLAAESRTTFRRRRRSYAIVVDEPAEPLQQELADGDDR